MQVSSGPYIPLDSAIEKLQDPTQCICQAEWGASACVSLAADRLICYAYVSVKVLNINHTIIIVSTTKLPSTNHSSFVEAAGININTVACTH